ncbi:hypothetical protein niasHT_000457 [Heterodera trifolii]|uniref:C2H2-type domain-containing protein n=1 Tax=Heterodera trifolii TaxID=157864 RepID=A0ABD2M2Y9_9BILA
METMEVMLVPVGSPFVHIVLDFPLYRHLKQKLHCQMERSARDIFANDVKRSDNLRKRHLLKLLFNYGKVQHGRNETVMQVVFGIPNSLLNNLAFLRHFGREPLLDVLKGNELPNLSGASTSPKSLQRNVFLCPNCRIASCSSLVFLPFCPRPFAALKIESFSCCFQHTTNSALKMMNAQQPQQFLCGATKTDGTICQRMFDSTGARATHRRRARVHQGLIDYDFVCNVCGGGCSTATTLRTHCVRLHPTMSSPPHLTQGNRISFVRGQILSVSVNANSVGEIDAISSYYNATLPDGGITLVNNAVEFNDVVEINEDQENELANMPFLMATIRNIAEDVYADRHDGQLPPTQHINIEVSPSDQLIFGDSGNSNMVCSLYSLWTGRCNRMDTVLSASVDPLGGLHSVGGLLHKVQIAKDLNIRNFVLSREDEEDVGEIGADVTEGINFIYHDDISEVLNSVMF